MDTTNIMAILADHASAIDTSWTLLGAALVFFMQAGFAMVETGFTRSKNAGNIIMKNLMDFALGTVAFWLAGFGIIAGSVCQAIGNPFYSLIISVCRQLVVLLPVAWLLAQTGRLDLVWTAFIIAEIVSATLSGIFLRRTFRSAKALLNS